MKQKNLQTDFGVKDSDHAWTFAAPKPQAVERYAYKCRTCLAIYATPGRIAHSVAICQVCSDSNIDLMGQVGLDNTIRREDLDCKCDGRCVHALGPKCSCMCGGVNHQKGIEGYARVVRNVHGTLLDIADADIRIKHQQIGQEYKTKRDQALSKLDSLPEIERYNAGQFIPDKDAWWRITDFKRKLRSAFDAKSHTTRIKKLDQLLAV